MSGASIPRIIEGVQYYTPYLIQMFVYFWIDFFKAISPVWPRKSIKGQLMLITGAGSGMGRESAKQFAHQGVRLILWDVNEEGLNETKEILLQNGHENVQIMRVNLGDHDDVKRAGAEVRDKFGVPDLIFNNAGINGAFSLTECDMDKYDNTMNINSRAIVTVVNEFLNDMIERNSGHLITLTSIAGYQGAGGLIAYSMSKFAAVGYMESVRNEMKSKKVDVKCTTIAPYYVKTPLTRGVEYDNYWAPMCEPEYVVSQIVEGVLRESEEIFIPKWSWVYVVLKGVLSTRVMDLFTEAFEVHTLPIGFERFRQQQAKLNGENGLPTNGASH
ncbi:unnamed protein product [Bursaphelenchus xylophilus]|uniref:(pine wood nematode) hypothetical protein n=1 Tax=Bursaphelenchus xylophilus TaxID=6326 RepID=A0A1I7RW96_BURXY|nr:unnamed protein product [Bursaphelenchus xylophilus]CAG9095322.1 unnamed protein product [Bursaphelenchus xylophilus]